MLQRTTYFSKDRAMRYVLNHASYVDERHRIVYVETPKVSCSSIKYMLCGLTTPSPIGYLPQSHATSAVMRIHDREQMPFPPLAAFSGERLQAILTEPGWFRFCVVRHPYDRFFSGWRDKIFLVEPGYEKYQADKSQKFVEFTEFVAKVLAEDPQSCDVHWRLQVALLQPDHINYTKVYHLSDVAQLPADLTAHLKTAGVADQALVMPRVNESWSIRPEGFLTAEITAKLRRFYEADFEKFQFPEREASAGPAITAESLVSEFTNAVYDRNRVIMEHIRRNNRRLRAINFLNRFRPIRYKT